MQAERPVKTDNREAAVAERLEGRGVNSCVLGAAARTGFSGLGADWSFMGHSMMGHAPCLAARAIDLELMAKAVR